MKRGSHGSPPRRSILRQEISAAREAFVRMLSGLQAVQWDEPSLCAGWAVRDVVAHLVRIDHCYRWPHAFLFGLVRHGLSINRFLAEDGRRAAAGRRPDELIASLARTRYEDAPAWRFHPQPAMALGELVIHAQDIRRPLGLSGKPTTSQLEIVADVLVRPAPRPFRYPWGAPSRPPVRFEATDAEWGGGTGPEVGGPLEAIVMVLAGRDAAVADLDGEGVSLLTKGGRPRGLDG